MANVLWLQGGACSGNTMSFLNAEEPTVVELITDFGLNILWHPTTGLQIGDQVQDLLKDIISGKEQMDILVYEGSLVEGPNGTGTMNYFADRPMKDWIKELQTHASPSVIIGLCGNKADLEKKVTSETAKALAERHSLVFYEVSACTGENVQECFLGIAKKLPQTPPRRSQGLNLQNQQVSSPDSSCC